MSTEDWFRQQAEGGLDVEGPPDGVQRIQARIRARTRRRRLTVTVGAVAMVVAAVSVSGVLLQNWLSGPDPAKQPGPAAAPEATAAPWIDAKGQPFQASEAPWRQWRNCAPPDIDITVGRQGAFQGNATQQLTLANTSTTDCVLRGAPRITAVANKGGAHPVAVGSYSQTAVPLQSGAMARVVVGAPAGCSEQGEIARSLEVAVNDRAVPRTASDTWVPLACGEPSLLVFEPVDEPEANGPLNSLEATWEGPTSAESGATIDYVVALHNPTEEDIALEPCPSYTQTAEDRLAETLLLNCEAVPVIKAGETARFAMRLTVPESPDSEIKVGWHLEAENGATAGAVLTLN